MKEIEIPMLEVIEQLNKEAELIKGQCKQRRSATHKSLAALYALMEEEITTTDDEDKAEAQPVLVS